MMNVVIYVYEKSKLNKTRQTA